MARALSNVNPRKVKTNGVALVGITGDNSRSAYGDIRNNYEGSLQPALGAAHDQIVLEQLVNIEEDVTTLVTFSLVDGTLVYGLTPVEDVELLGLRNGKKIKAGNLAKQLGGGEINPTDVLDYRHMPTHFRPTDHTKLRDRSVQQGVALIGESLKWKSLGRDVSATGAWVADGVDLGSDLDAASCAEIMTALEGVGFYNNYGALIGVLDRRFRNELIRSIGYSRLVTDQPMELNEARLNELRPEVGQFTTEKMIEWYMAQQGLASSVDENLFLSRSTRPADIAVTAGQLSTVVQQASVLMTQPPAQD
jgi:hypothetical protein